MSHRELVETWFRRVWTEQDASAIDELFVPDGTTKGLAAGPATDPAGFRAFHAAMSAQLSDLAFTVERAVSEGEWVFAVLKLTARTSRTGDPIATQGAIAWRVADGKVREAHDHWNFVDLFAQAGLLPADAMGRLLAGEKLA